MFGLGGEVTGGEVKRSDSANQKVNDRSENGNLKKT